MPCAHSSRRCNKDPCCYTSRHIRHQTRPCQQPCCWRERRKDSASPRGIGCLADPEPGSREAGGGTTKARAAAQLQGTKANAKAGTPQTRSSASTCCRCKLNHTDSCVRACVCVCLFALACRSLARPISRVRPSARAPFFLFVLFFRSRPCHITWMEVLGRSHLRDACVLPGLLRTPMSWACCCCSALR